MLFKEGAKRKDVKEDLGEDIGSRIDEDDVGSTSEGDCESQKAENEDLEEEETPQERVARLKLEWEEASAMVGHIKRKGRRAGDVVYDTALREAEEAEARWRRERGPIPLDRRQRKNREAITRAEARLQGYRTNMEDLDAEYQKKKEEMQQNYDDEAGKIAALRRDAAELRKEEADGDGMASQHHYGDGEHLWDAAQKATVDINAWGSDLAALVDALGNEQAKQKMSEVLASMACTQDLLRNAADDEEDDDEEDGDSRDAMDWSQQERNEWHGREASARDDAQRAFELRQEQLDMENLQRGGDHEALASAIANCQAKEAAGTGVKDRKHEMPSKEMAIGSDDQ